MSISGSILTQKWAGTEFFCDALRNDGRSAHRHTLPSRLRTFIQVQILKFGGYVTLQKPLIFGFPLFG
jgi:hypothetical protein